MKKLPSIFIILLIFFCTNTSAAIRLVALTNKGNPTVTLQWNMVNYGGGTAYTLFKSSDGVIWETTAANPVFRNYTASTVLAYRDNFSDEQQLYYKVKVYDTNENIVEVSNIAKVSNPAHSRIIEKSFERENAIHETPIANSNSSWQIAANPVHGMLNLIYKSNEIIKGVINIIIQDGTGKAIIRFRAASNNKQVHIPVSNLHTGIYFIKINVTNEVQLNAKFIKE